MTRDALLDQIYGAVADAARWPDLLVELSDYLECIGGMLIYNAPPVGKNLLLLGRLDPEYTTVFHKYHVWNPWTVAMMVQPVDRVVVSGSLVDRRIIHTTAFSADVLAPQRIEDMISFRHRAFDADGGVGGISFALSARNVDRADQIRRRLQHLTPHLSRAIDATLRLGPLVDGSRKLVSVLQLMPTPALLLDGKGRIVHANPAAELLLHDGDGLTCQANSGLRLAATRSDENHALTLTLAKALQVAAGSNDQLGEPLRITRLSGDAPLLVVPVPLPPPTFVFWELSESARVMVLIVEPRTRKAAAAALLQTTFGLTNAEARIATVVGSGFSGPQTAHVLGISPATVKTHLAHCFEKIGICSQVELARIIAALPVDHSRLDGLNKRTDSS